MLQANKPFSNPVYRHVKIWAQPYRLVQGSVRSPYWRWLFCRLVHGPWVMFWHTRHSPTHSRLKSLRMWLVPFLIKINNVKSPSFLAIPVFQTAPPVIEMGDYLLCLLQCNAPPPFTNQHKKIWIANVSRTRLTFPPHKMVGFFIIVEISKNYYIGVCRCLSWQDN